MIQCANIENISQSKPGDSIRILKKSGAAQAEFSRGMTLIEVLVVLALAAMIGGFALFMSMETYRGTSFRSDRDLLVSLLERARAQAVNNLCIGVCTNGKPHGVAIRPSDHPNSYVGFQGNSYLTRDVAVDDIFDASPVVAATGLTEAVFASLAGTSTTLGGFSVTLTDAGGHSSAITVSALGQIIWTN